MLKSNLILVACLFWTFSVFGQASLNQLKNAPLHAGESRIFKAPFKPLVEFSRAAMREAGLEIESVEKIDTETYMLIGKRRASGFSWGEMVRVSIIGQDDASKTIVRVYTKKRVKLNITAKGDYSQSIFSSIESQIELNADEFEQSPPTVASRSNREEKPSQPKASPSKATVSNDIPNDSKLALVIGNARYKSAPLKNPVNDANAISAELSNSGFKVLKHTNVSKREMRDAIRSFGDQLLENRGVGLFYFAGHGIQFNGRNYLIPVDADIQKEYDIEDQAVAADMVLQMMELYQNRVNIVILDACRNNPYSRGFRSAEQGLAPISITPTGSIIAFSTAPGQTASDGEGRNGLFTQELIKSMKKEGMSLEEVFKDVRINVAKLSNDGQIPWTNSSLMGDFYFKPDND